MRLKSLPIIIFMGLMFIVAIAQNTVTQSANNDLEQKMVSRNQLVERTLKSGGRIIQHISDRGEIWDDIAELYGVDVADLKAMNPTIEILYAGMEIDVPVLKTEYELREMMIMRSNPLYAKAQNVFDVGDYKEAINIYNQIIKNGDALLVAYYNRGRAYYQRDKFGKAANDFNYVMQNDRHDQFPNASTYYNHANEINQQKSQERAQFWGNLLAGVVGAVGVTAEIYAASQMSSMSNQSSISGSGSSNLDYLLDPRYAMQQVAIQNEQEYQQFSAYNRKPDGSMYTREEFMALKAEAYAASNSQYSVSTESQTSEPAYESHSHSSSSSSKSHQDCPSLKVANGKWYCANTGKCGMCGGDGLMDDMFGHGPNYLKCTLCNGTGKCKYCNP